MADTTRPLLRWLAAHDSPGLVVLACDDAPLPRVARGAVVVRLEGCVRDADVGLPAQLLAVGVGAVQVLPCPTEPEDGAARVEDWRSVLGDGVGPFVPPARRGTSRAEVLTIGDVPVPRRVLLGLDLGDSPLLAPELDDAGRSLVALRLLEAQGRATPAPAAPLDGSGPDEAAPLAGGATMLTVSGCVACGVCVRACPHDALALEHDGTTSTLVHLREACRSELECVRLCPVDAFTAAGPVPLAEALRTPVLTLAEVRTQPCERCGARHPAEEGALCATCRFREQNAFGSALPPGALDRLGALRPPSSPHGA